MVRIFISYRREDTIAYAGRIYDRLAAQFGAPNVFMDIDTLEPGVDFVDALERTVSSCDVFLAIIGRQWLTVKDEDGRPRLTNPEDFIALEIGAALERRNIRVVPVLVAGARMPQSIDLPPRLTDLARRQALILPDIGFHQTLGRLTQSVEKMQQERAEREKAEADARAEQERIAREKAEAAARAEQERIAREKADADARAEQERIAREKADADARAEQVRIAREKADADARAEQERIARQKADADARAEQERIAREKSDADARAEQERIAREKAEAEARAEQERIAREKSEAAALAEQERIAREKAEADARAEQERLAREKAEKERRDRARPPRKIPRLAVALVPVVVALAFIWWFASHHAETPFPVTTPPEENASTPTSTPTPTATPTPVETPKEEPVLTPTPTPTPTPKPTPVEASTPPAAAGSSFKPSGRDPSTPVSSGIVYNYKTLGAIETAVAKDPRNADLRSDYAEALLSIGDVPDALEQYRVSTTLPPKIIGRAYLYRDYAQALEKNGHLPEALAVAKKVLGFWPVSTELSCGGFEEKLLGRLYEENHDSAGAIAMWQDLKSKLSAKGEGTADCDAQIKRLRTEGR